MKTIAIMQPYLFPYIGYFQLLAHVDELIVLDNVHFIKKGWINRNRILLNDKPFTFTLPIAKASQNALICDLYLHERSYHTHQILQSIKHAYQKAPFFEQVYPILQTILTFEEDQLLPFILNSVHRLFDYLRLKLPIKLASEIPILGELKQEKRIIELCRITNATRYLNLPGGKSLYDGTNFASQGIELKFIENQATIYRQFNEPFLPDLSIIDILMFNNIEDTLGLLRKVKLEPSIIRT